MSTVGKETRACGYAADVLRVAAALDRAGLTVMKRVSNSLNIGVPPAIALARALREVDNPPSRSYPHLAASRRFDLPYWAVLAYRDDTAEGEQARELIRDRLTPEDVETLAQMLGPPTEQEEKSDA